MGIHDKVKQLSGYQEESTATNDEGGEQSPPARERKTIDPVNSAETDQLEKLLFKFAALIEKIEAERQEMKKLSQEVDTQKDTVGKMLVSLDNVIKSLPKTVDASVKASLDGASANLDFAVKKVCGEISRHVSYLTNQIPSELDQSFGKAVATINSAAGKAAATVTAMEAEKNRVGWQVIAVNVGVSCLVIFVLLGVVNRRFPWQLRGPTSQERTYIERGKALTKSWAQLPPKFQNELSRALTENE